MFAICVTSNVLESRINEALPQINEKWKKQLSRMGSGSWEAPAGKKMEAVLGREKTPLPSLGGWQSHRTATATRLNTRPGCREGARRALQLGSNCALWPHYALLWGSPGENQLMQVRRTGVSSLNVSTHVQTRDGRAGVIIRKWNP